MLNGDGHLVGIPIGRMQGDYRFSFILPLRAEMFRKIPQAVQLGIAISKPRHSGRPRCQSVSRAFCFSGPTAHVSERSFEPSSFDLHLESASVGW